MDLLTHKSCLFDFSAYKKLYLATNKCEAFFILFLWELHAASSLFLDAFDKIEDANKSFQAHFLPWALQMAKNKSQMGHHNRNAKPVLDWDDPNRELCPARAPSHQHFSDRTSGSGKSDSLFLFQYIYLMVAFQKSLITALKCDAIWGQCCIFHREQFDQHWVL